MSSFLSDPEFLSAASFGNFTGLSSPSYSKSEFVPLYSAASGIELTLPLLDGGGDGSDAAMKNHCNSVNGGFQSEAFAVSLMEVSGGSNAGTREPLFHENDVNQLSNNMSALHPYFPTSFLDKSPSVHDDNVFAPPPPSSLLSPDVGKGNLERDADENTSFSADFEGLSPLSFPHTVPSAMSVGGVGVGVTASSSSAFTNLSSALLTPPPPPSSSPLLFGDLSEAVLRGLDKSPFSMDAGAGEMMRFSTGKESVNSRQSLKDMPTTSFLDAPPSNSAALWSLSNLSDEVNINIPACPAAPLAPSAFDRDPWSQNLQQAELKVPQAAGQAATASIPPLVAEPTIVTWNTDFLSSPGYNVARGAQLSRWLPMQMKSKINLIKPVLRKENGCVCTASDNADSNVLLVLHPELLLQGLFNNPVIGLIGMKQRMSDLAWLSDSRIACFCGEGNAQIYSFAPKENKIQLIAEFKGLHQQRVREMASNPCCDHQVASGGSDKRLLVWDTGTGQVLTSASQLDDVGSVKWGTQSPDIITATLDIGRFVLYDSRMSFSKPQDSVDLAHLDLFSHEMFSPHKVLLGYGDGELVQIDLRNSSKIISRCKDPWVDAIGNICYNASATAFVTSGLTDFTVWNHLESEARVWSHKASDPNVLANDNGCSMSAIFLDPTTVLSTSSEGHIDIFVQDLKIRQPEDES